MKLKLIISYVGTNYCGWQIQTKQNSPTIQNELEKALFSIFNEPIRVVGASRTDSGVHADEQVAHCVLPFTPKNMQWQRAINNLLPHDIRIVDALEVGESFHAHLDSTGKIYTYSLWTHESYTPPKLYPFVHHCGKVDFSKIEQAIPYLQGTHDFKSLENAGTELVHTVRTLEYICIKNISEHYYDIEFKGNGFLKQMIRNIVGLLVFIGQGRIEAYEIPSILEAKKRTALFPTAPAKGLTLTKVLY